MHLRGTQRNCPIEAIPNVHLQRISIQSMSVFHQKIGFHKLLNYFQGSYVSGKCQGNLNFFKVRELSGNFSVCQGKLDIS